MKLFIKVRFLMFFCYNLLVLHCVAQNGNIWLKPPNFKLDFNAGATFINPYQINVPAHGGHEANASYCDDNGELFCWMVGSRIYNKADTVMKNGDSLSGAIASQQGGVILPAPGNPDFLYVFYPGDQSTPPTGFPWELDSLAYCIIDKTQDSGKGRVIQKNVLLPTEAREKIAATRHCNGVDWWVVVPAWHTNEYHSYLLTAAGVDSMPIISTIGQIHDDTSGFNDNSMGDLTIAPNGRIMVSQYLYDGKIEAYTFNNETGEVGQVLFVDDCDEYIFNNRDLTNPFAGTFSADSRYYYALNGIPFPLGWKIRQYDMYAGSDTAILASKYKLFPDSVIRRMNWGMQLGPDGKIYLLEDSSATNPDVYLTVINHPERPGMACDIQFLTQMVSNTSSVSFVYKMPTFPDCIFARKHTATLHLPLCGGLDSALVVFDTLLNVVHDFTWNFGDPASGANNTATGTDPVHAFTAPGNCTITLTATNACNTFTITRNVFIGISTAVPPVITQNGFQLESTPGVSYQWFLNGQPIPVATFQSIIPTQAGMYTVQVSDAGGCVLQSEGFYLNVTQSMQKEKSQLKIYPNPTTGQVYIKCGSLIQKVEAVNPLGQVNTLSYHNDLADVSVLAKGWYVLLVHTAKGLERAKLVVE